MWRIIFLLLMIPVILDYHLASVVLFTMILIWNAILENKIRRTIELSAKNDQIIIKYIGEFINGLANYAKEVEKASRKQGRTDQETPERTSEPE